jgi:hypothetical protein
MFKSLTFVNKPHSLAWQLIGAEPFAKKIMTDSENPSLHGAKYCGVIHCRNNIALTIDPRTGKLARFHPWPHPSNVKRGVKDEAEKKAHKLEQ